MFVYKISPAKMMFCVTFDVELALITIMVIVRFPAGNCDDVSKAFCRERNRPIETEKADLYVLIDATPGQKLTLQCHYCDEKDDQRAKNWYKIDHLGAPGAHEVALDMSSSENKSKVHVNNEHSLVIHDFNFTDTGLYYCQRFEEEKAEEKFNYLVDLIYNENLTSVETGNLTDWSKYHDEYFAPINVMFVDSQGVEFRQVREEFGIDMEMVTQWRLWGSCEVCGRPQNEGIRKKTGLCRIKLSHGRSYKPKNLTNGSDPAELDGIHFSNANAVGCRSQLLGRIFPGISNLTKIVPNFVQTEHCEGICNPDSEGEGRGWKTGKKAAFKYRKTFVLAENSHLTIICPEATLDSVVVWKKDKKVLEPGESVEPPNPDDAPRIIVDTFNTLYLVGVEKSEEGNYTCEVDGVRMEQVIVFVISKSKLLTQAFVRHILYLGFVLLMTIPCYAAGLIIACTRKRYFKGYQQLKETAEQKKRYGNIHQANKDLA